ncbi:MAG: GntR family transcriptional regulator [Rhodobacteraceae bacterium]|nr:GntR family transcriptional regulator [Paracoccaceae bacterium]
MPKPASNVDRLYRELRQMAANFAFKPDERINESELTLRLGASRTPMREALNRLAAEGFLTLQAGRGFFCRSLTPKRILELYEARVAVECEALKLSCERASNEDITALADHLEGVETRYTRSTDADELLEIDEGFHTRLAELSSNSELVSMLKNLNDRIRYIRMIDLKRMRSEAGGARQNQPLSAHRAILRALQKRDAQGADTAMRSHIGRRREEATEAVRIAYSQLYVPVD